MIEISNELHAQIKVLRHELEVMKLRLSLMEASRTEESHQYETVERRLNWLDENYKDQQMELDNIMRRISNDFPVAPWNVD